MAAIRPAVTRVLAAAVFWLALVSPITTQEDPFAPFGPDFHPTTGERTRLDSGKPIVIVGRERDGHLLLGAAVRVQTTPERLEAWTHDIEHVRHPRYAPQVGLWSTPARVEDVASLTLDRPDLDDLARCKPNDCGLKLSANEIRLMRTAHDDADRTTVFRRILTDRAISYQACGDRCLSLYESDEEPVNGERSFNQLLDRTPHFSLRFPELATALRRYPAEGTAASVSTLYWSKQQLGRKPIVSITHQMVTRLPGIAPAIVVTSKQVYASHYLNAALTMMALSGREDRRYLIYVHRSHVDALEGPLGSLVRRVIERRLRAEAPALLQRFRDHLEAPLHSHR